MGWRAADWDRAAQIPGVDHRRGAAFRPGLYRARPPQELGAPRPSGLDRSEEVQQQALELSKVAVEVDPFDARAAPLLRLVLGARAPVRPGRAELRPRPRAQRERPLDAHLERLGDGYCEAPRGPRARRSGAPDRPNPSRAHWGYQAQTRFLCEDHTGSVTAAARALNVLPFLSAWHAAALGHLGYREDARDKARLGACGSAAMWSRRPCRIAPRLFRIRCERPRWRLRTSAAARFAPAHERQPAELLPLARRASARRFF